MKTAAGILFTDGKSILLLKRSEKEEKHKNKWSIPGGKGHVDEEPLEVATRETKEETGLQEIPGKKFASFVKNNEIYNFTTFLYKVSEKFKVTLSKEHTEYKWIPIKNIKKFDLHPKFDESLPQFLKAIYEKTKIFTEWKTFTEWLEITLALNS